MEWVCLFFGGGDPCSGSLGFAVFGLFLVFGGDVPLNPLKVNPLQGM